MRLEAYTCNERRYNLDGIREVITYNCMGYAPDSKVHGANMGPTWGRQDPGWPHVGHMNLAIWGLHLHKLLYRMHCKIPTASEPSEAKSGKTWNQSFKYTTILFDVILVILVINLPNINLIRCQAPKWLWQKDMIVLYTERNCANTMIWLIFCLLEVLLHGLLQACYIWLLPWEPICHHDVDGKNT